MEECDGHELKMVSPESDNKNVCFVLNDDEFEEGRLCRVCKKVLQLTNKITINCVI